MYHEFMETPTLPTPVGDRIGEGLARLAAAMRAHDWRRSKTVGRNPTQLAILHLLRGRIGGMSVKDVAAHLAVSQPTATDSIRALERKGLVSKSGATSDRRVVTVALTDRARSEAQSGEPSPGFGEQAVAALSDDERKDLLVMLVKMIRHLQEIDAIPIQRMCVSCRYFAPFAHADAARPHRCNFVDAPFGQRDIRIDCRDHEIADPAFRAATWNAFRQGSASPPPGS